MTSYAAVTAEGQWTITTRESRLLTMDFTNLLDTGEVVTAVSGTNGGITLGVTDASSVLTIGSPSINAAAITDDRGDTISIGKAVQVRVSAANGVAGTVYELRFVVATDSSNRIEQVGKLQVVS